MAEVYLATEGGRVRDDAARSGADRLQALEERVASIWRDEIFSTRLVKAIRDGAIDRRLYALYLIQTYHYTTHNSRNQALVGVRSLGVSDMYVRFCFQHAAEETGHEHMALRDLRALGIAGVDTIPPPLPETETLIAYLYWISATGNPVRRLGYSFWAESSYDFITPLIDRVRTVLGLTPAQMTFFIAHAKIDEEHAREVRAMLRANCVTDDDWRDVETAMVTSLRLTGQMMEAVYDSYEQFVPAS